MLVLSIILGILLIGCGVTCIMTPIATTMSLMYFYLFILFIVGIFTLIRCIAYKRFGLEFVYSILTILAGGFILYSPNLTFVTQQIMLYIMAGWLFLRGVVDIVICFKTRPYIGAGAFIFSLIISVLIMISGIYSIVHPMVFSEMLGILASAYLIVEGMDIIVSSILVRTFAFRYR